MNSKITVISYSVTIVKYNNIHLLHFIECDVMCNGALKSNIYQGRRLWNTENVILTKAEGHGQYRFSVLHNTSYCTK
jgi:hypothetical protein